MDKVYVVIMFPDVHPKRAFCLDRRYALLGDNVKLWGKIKMGDIVEHDDKFFPTMRHQVPDWAWELKDKGERHIVFWTNYYEGR